MKRKMCIRPITFGIILLTLTFGCKKDKTNDNNSPTFTIGQSYGGGIIFYIDNTGQHGLIATPSNQGTSIPWSNGSLLTTTATGTNVGAGQINTNAIISVQGIGNYAASICDALELNGYSDWFLPSKDELNLLYQQKVAGTVTGFANAAYWSSTEFNNDNAWWLHFGDIAWGWENCYTDGSYFYPSVAGKPSLIYVRAIRAF